MNIALWVLQVLLAAAYLFSGSTKFVMSVAEMQAGSPVAFPGWFLHFIGTCEILGGIGMILPGLLRIKPGLTPLAAAGIVIIMTGATVITLMGPMAPVAALPFSLGCIAAFVAYGRWKLRPIQGR